jgi:hypothetical protein
MLACLKPTQDTPKEESKNKNKKTSSRAPIDDEKNVGARCQ